MSSPGVDLYSTDVCCARRFKKRINFLTPVLRNAFTNYCTFEWLLNAGIKQSYL